ncbi:MAG: hypothetical protein BGO01_12935 [Armatimonadetes bacterium 55-13]|nr:hypothetical protein [Armatimonadota bacterium]ODU52638.1 MAG: hypothetical protein ABT09_02545 [bacterium SCN 57-13]OJU61814.1 MAG: hypothetical protein BGO01_12935 [Armatimonadetes bacterium 55-13]
MSVGLDADNDLGPILTRGGRSYDFDALEALVDYWKNWAIIAAGVVGLTTFFTGVLEYVRQGRQHRAENFVQMRRRFLETPQYREILDLLAGDDPKLREVSIQEKRNFVGFLEEVAVMVNSRLIRREVAHYMFGYYVQLTAKSTHFWEHLDRQSHYWRVFRAFAEDMAKVKAETQTNPNLHF